MLKRLSKSYKSYKSSGSYSSGLSTTSKPKPSTKRLQVVLAGARGCGKSHLLAQYAGSASGVAGEPPPSPKDAAEPDVIEMVRTVVALHGIQLQVMLWELTGLERHRETEVAYLAVGDVCILVYDRTSRESFEALQRVWLPALKQRCHNPNAVHCLLAHPAAASSTAARAVSAEEGQALADANGMIYEEPAALSYDAEALMLKLLTRAVFNDQLLSPRAHARIAAALGPVPAPQKEAPSAGVAPPLPSAATASTEQEEEAMPLHKAICAHSPLSAVTTLLDSFPAAASETLSDGRMALHVLCTARLPLPPLHDARAQQAYEVKLANWNDTLDLLLERFPEACAFRDAQGNLPVHLAANSSLSIPQLTASITKLLQAYPEAAKMEPLLLRSAVQRDEFPAEVLIKIVDADPDSVGVIHLEGGMHILQYAVRKPLPWEVTVYLLDVAHSYAEHLCSQKEREPLIVTAFKTEAAPEVVLELLRIKPRIFLSDVHDRSQHAGPFDWILKRQLYPLRAAHTEHVTSSDSDASRLDLPPSNSWPLSAKYCMSLQCALLRSGLDIQDCYKRSLADAADQLRGMNALHLAAEAGDTELVKQLCAAQRDDLLKIDHDGAIPLRIATDTHGPRHACSLLLEKETKAQSINGRYLPKRGAAGTECSTGVLEDGTHFMELAFDMHSQRNVLLKYFSRREEWEHECQIITRLGASGKAGTTISGLVDSFKMQVDSNVKVGSSLNPNNASRRKVTLPFCNVLEAGTRCLADLMYPQSMLTVEARQAIAGKILHGLSLMQSNKVAHMQLNPHSVLIDAKNHVSLRGFVGSRVFGERVDMPSCAQYCPPEVAIWALNRKDPKKRDKELKPPKADAFGDMWTLGCLIYEMEMNEPLFMGSSETDILMQVADWPEAAADSDKELAEVRADNPAVYNVIKSLLRKDPKERLTAKQLMTLAYMKEALLLKNVQFPAVQASPVQGLAELQAKAARQMQVLLAVGDSVLPPLFLLLPSEQSFATPRTPHPEDTRLPNDALGLGGYTPAEMAQALKTASSFRLVFCCQASPDSSCICPAHYSYELAGARAAALLRSAAPVLSIVATSLLVTAAAADSRMSMRIDGLPDHDVLVAVCDYYDGALAARLKDIHGSSPRDPSKAKEITALLNSMKQLPVGDLMEQALELFGLSDLFEPAYAALAEICRALRINPRRGQVGRLQRAVHKESGSFHWVCAEHALGEGYLPMSSLSSHPAPMEPSTPQDTPFVTPFGSRRTSMAATPLNSHRVMEASQPPSTRVGSVPGHGGGPRLRLPSKGPSNLGSGAASYRSNLSGSSTPLAAPRGIAGRPFMPPLALGSLPQVPASPQAVQGPAGFHSEDVSDDDLPSNSSDSAESSPHRRRRDGGGGLGRVEVEVEAMMTNKLAALEARMEEHFLSLESQMRTLGAPGAGSGMADPGAADTSSGARRRTSPERLRPLQLQAELSISLSGSLLAGEKLVCLFMCEGKEGLLGSPPYALDLRVSAPTTAVLYIEVRRSHDRRANAHPARPPVALGQVMIPIASFNRGSGRYRNSYKLGKLPSLDPASAMVGGVMLVDYRLSEAVATPVASANPTPNPKSMSRPRGSSSGTPRRGGLAPLSLTFGKTASAATGPVGNDAHVMI